MAKILVAGSLAFDNIMTFPGYFKDHILPEKIETINLSFLAEKLTKQRGGCAANISYSLALLGEKPIAVGAAGVDFKEYEKYLRNLNIDTSGIHIFEDEMTASCFITTDKAGNQITGFYMGAMTRAREISLKDCGTSDTKICIVAPDDPEGMLRHCREAKEVDIPLLFDPSFQVSAISGEDLWTCAKGSYGVILNEYEYALLQEKTKKTHEEILGVVEFLIVTLGEKGSIIRNNKGDRLEIPPATPKEVLDPTGAGDAYRSGLLSGLVQGCDLLTSGRRGSVAATYAIEHVGTQNHTYSVKDFNERYDQNFG